MEKVVRDVINALFGKHPLKKPKWRISQETRKLLKGLYVKEGSFPLPLKLVPATPARILHRDVLRDAKGGVVLFDEKGKRAGRIEVVYAISNLRQPISLWYKGDLIAFVEE